MEESILKVLAKLEAQLRGHDLTKEERLAVDRLLSASNESNVRYSQLAYELGAKDVIGILRELDLKQYRDIC